MAALYTNAASILDKILKKKGTLKSLVIENGFSNKKKLYALVCETLKYRTIIEEIMEISNLKKHEKQLKNSLALVLVYECLFGQGLKCGGRFKQVIMRNRSSFNAALARIKIKAKVTNNADLLPKNVLTAASIPRYARVNLLQASIDDILEQFSNEGYVVKTSPENLEKGDKSVYLDPHIQDVLVFPPGTDLHNHPLYNKGHVILQDKASCLPAHILNPPPGSHVIDACAAPGNKTSHLASRMSNNGHIFAFDTDNQRLKVMRKLMQTAGVECASMTNMSFLKVDPTAEEYKKVEYIVVDPSCSGSGIVSRMDPCTDQSEAEELKQRLESLSQFQLSAVVHALSFPAVKKVVYSTCSIHQKENEDVVLQALKKFSGVFELSQIMDNWTQRGLPVFPGAEKCIRASPELTNTNGFFVALFTRIQDKRSITKLVNVTEENCSLDDINDKQQKCFKDANTFKRMRDRSTKKSNRKKRKKSNLCDGTPGAKQSAKGINDKPRTIFENAYKVNSGIDSKKHKRKKSKKDTFCNDTPRTIQPSDGIQKQASFEDANALKRRSESNWKKLKKKKRKMVA